jgi:hypothetical protein
MLCAYSYLHLQHDRILVPSVSADLIPEAVRRKPAGFDRAPAQLPHQVRQPPAGACGSATLRDLQNIEAGNHAAPY